MLLSRYSSADMISRAGKVGCFKACTLYSSADMISRAGEDRCYKVGTMVQRCNLERTKMYAIMQVQRYVQTCNLERTKMYAIIQVQRCRHVIQSGQRCTL